MSWDRNCAVQCGRTYYASHPKFHGFGNSSVAADVGSADLFGSNLVYCFRGSKETLDWILDFFAVPGTDNADKAAQYLGMGPVHAGFLIGAMALLPQIKQDAQGRPFSLTGHSLGGALALLVGALLTQDGTPPVQIVTFGAPKVGFSAFVDVLHGVPVREYRYGADPVPLVPDWPYMHVNQVQIGKPVRNLFQNHAITNYIGALNV